MEEPTEPGLMVSAPLLWITPEVFRLKVSPVSVMALPELVTLVAAFQPIVAAPMSMADLVPAVPVPISPVMAMGPALARMFEELSATPHC